jgi:hypothetical protein
MRRSRGTGDIAPALSSGELDWLAEQLAEGLVEHSAEGLVEGLAERWAEVSAVGSPEGSAGQLEQKR